MINIDKEIKKLKNIEKEKQEKLDKEKVGDFLDIDMFNYFLDESSSSFFYKFIIDIKNKEKTNLIPVFYNSCNEINNFIEYISKFLVNNKVIIVKGFFDIVIEKLEKLENKRNEIRFIILDNILDNLYDKRIDYNKIAEIYLNEKIKAYFILKSYTKNLPEIFKILNLKKKWINDYNLYEFRHNFDIYNIKIYTQILDENDVLIFEINYFHFFKVKFTNIIKVLEFFNEGIEMNSAILQLNDNFSMNFDDRLFIIYIKNSEINTKLQFYNSPILRTELNNFIIKHKKDLYLLK